MDTSTNSSSADALRLWLERSGTHTFLDIEILLQVSTTPCQSKQQSSSAVVPHAFTFVSMPPPAIVSGGVVVSSISHTPGFVPPSPSVIVPHHPHVHTHSAHSAAYVYPSQVGVVQSPTTPVNSTRSSGHWAHIAMYYLVEHIARWKRFVFRFDKPFPSLQALKGIIGDAPMLEEFEVTGGDNPYHSREDIHWTWLPSCETGSFPNLNSLHIENMPFKWSSRMLNNCFLRSLTLHSNNDYQLSVDRLLLIIGHNSSTLRELSLNFSTLHNNVLPLMPVTLPQLTDLTLGGHFQMHLILDNIIVPSLAALTLDMEPRDGLEDMISSLLARSVSPPLNLLSLSYSSAPYYIGNTLTTTFLNELDVTTLQISQTIVEPLLVALSAPDEDNNDQWICPHLNTLCLRSCHTSHQTDLVQKLVQMVDARNPLVPGHTGASGPSSVPTASSFGFVATQGSTSSTMSPTSSGVPARLKCLVLYDLGGIGDDVLEWLRSRVDEVTCTELPYIPSPRTPPYAYL